MDSDEVMYHGACGNWHEYMTDCPGSQPCPTCGFARLPLKAQCDHCGVREWSEPQRCPPHYFDAAFVSDDKGGAIYCRYCGLVMSLEVPAIEAPAEERIEDSADVHPPK